MGKATVIKKILPENNPRVRRLEVDAKLHEMQMKRLEGLDNDIANALLEYEQQGGPAIAEDQFIKMMETDPDGTATRLAAQRQHVPRVEQSRQVEYSSLEAEAMLANGEDPVSVFRETGWYRVPKGPKDRRMRFYLSDADSKIDHSALRRAAEEQGIEPGKSQHVTMTVGDVLVHDDLYEVYPELADVELVVSMRQKKDGSMIIYDPERAATGVTAQQGQRKGQGNYWVGIYNTTENDLDAKKALIHEINHVIQNLEGWPRGSSSAHWEELIFPAQRAYFDIQIANDILDMRVDIDDMGDVMRYAQELAESNPALDQNLAEDLIAEVMNEPNLEEYLGISEAVYNKSLRDMSLFLKQVGNREPENVDKFLRSAPVGVVRGLTRSRYLRTQGEAESRIREALIDMTKEELRAMPRTPIQTINDEGIAVKELVE